MKQLWDYGLDFEKNNKNSTYLKPMVDKFGLPSVELAELLWNYVQYVRKSFATFDTDSPMLAAKALFGSMATEKVFQNWHDLIHLTIKSRMIAAEMIQDKYTCQNLIENSFINKSNVNQDTICDGKDDKAEFANLIESFVDQCYFLTEPNVKKFNDKYK